MTKQAVVVRRKMDTPIAVVATLGIELTIFSCCSACPSVKKKIKTHTNHLKTSVKQPEKVLTCNLRPDAKHVFWNKWLSDMFTSFDSDSMMQTFSEGFTCITEKVILVSLVTLLTSCTSCWFPLVTCFGSDKEVSAVNEVSWFLLSLVQDFTSLPGPYLGHLLMVVLM